MKPLGRKSITESKYKEVISLLWEVMESYFGAQYNLIGENEKALEILKGVKG